MGTKPVDLVDWRTLAKPSTPQEKARSATERRVQSCDHCPADVVWARTKDGPRRTDGSICLDAKPLHDGAYVVSEWADKDLHAEELPQTTRRAYVAQGWVLYLPHRLTCANSAKWGKPGKRTRNPYAKPASPTRPVARKRGRA